MCILILFVPSTARKEAQKIRDFDKYQKSVIEKVEKEKKSKKKKVKGNEWDKVLDTYEILVEDFNLNEENSSGRNNSPKKKRKKNVNIFCREE